MNAFTSTVKWTEDNLLDDVDAVVQLLFLQERMNVLKERAQVRVTVTVRHDERHAVT